MSHSASIVWKCIAIGIMFSLLLAAIVWGYRMRPGHRPCVSLEYIIEDENERMYLSRKELNTLLLAHDIYPVGKAMDSLPLYRIEQTIQKHPMVRTAECYLTQDDKMKIRLTQRVPLLRVQTLNETYFIDTDRRVMQARSTVKDQVPVVTGVVAVRMASQQLADFARWIQQNQYWRERIRYVRVQSPQMMYVYLRGENQPRVVLGEISNYASKLNKLRLFIENSPKDIHRENYTELDVRFRGQVIGRTY